MEMTFGVVDHLDKNHQPLHEMYADRLQLIEQYDTAGFYAFHLTEHHATPLGLAPSPNVFLASAIQRTQSLRFTSLIYILPLYDPIRLACEVCMLDQLSHGRIGIGVGRGISPYELSYFNINHLASREIFQESFEVMMLALTRERVHFKGDYFTYRGIPIEVRPYQQPHPPLWYGPGSPESVAWCAERAMNIVSLRPENTARQQIDQYKAVYATTYGDTPLPRLGLTRHLYIAESDAEAQAIGWRGFRLWYDRFAYLWRINDPRPIADDGGAALMATRAIFGSPATVRAEIERQIEATGANYFVTRFAYGDLTYEESMRSLHLFTAEVMPHFQPSSQ